MVTAVSINYVLLMQSYFTILLYVEWKKVLYQFGGPRGIQCRVNHLMISPVI